MTSGTLEVTSKFLLYMGETSRKVYSKAGASLHHSKKMTDFFFGTIFAFFKNMTAACTQHTQWSGKMGYEPRHKRQLQANKTCSDIAYDRLKMGNVQITVYGLVIY